MIVRLMREVREPGGSGPWNGMYALQQLLRSRAPDWLEIGGDPSDDELCWFWNWQDIDLVLEWINRRLPFLLGPNVIFAWSGNPGGGHGEKEILETPSCRAFMCHSAWYADLIRGALGPRSTAKIICWPYPIWAQPAGPEPDEHDVLIVDKSSGGRVLLEAAIRANFPNAATVRYGAFARQELYELARRSRTCVYLCDDESGGLATAEIMLAGCPVIGIERGAPFVLSGSTGFRVEQLAPDPVLHAIRTCHNFDRQKVRAAAQRIFDGDRIARAVIEALEYFRCPPAPSMNDSSVPNLGAPVESALS